MKTSRNGWVAVAVAAVLIAGGADSLHAATITWDGNGDANNDGNWSTALNWSDNGDPANDSITLPDVNGNGNSGNPTRTITVDSAYSANALTINQTTAGFTNKLVLAANLTVANTLTNHGMIAGTGNRTLSARDVQMMAGSAISGITNISANTFSIRSAAPASFDLTGTTLMRVNNAATTTADYEAAASGTGTDFKIRKLYVGNAGTGNLYDGKRHRLVNTYLNSADQASEYFLVGTIDASTSYEQEFDFNGQRLVIDGGVANYSGGQVRLSNRSAGHGIMEFRTLGGNLDLVKREIGVSGGGILEIIGPASIINASLYDPGTALGIAGGTIAFNGNFRAADGMNVGFNIANSTNTVDLSGNTFTFYRSTTYGGLSVSSKATFIVKGNVAGDQNNYNSTGRGLRAVGTTKSGTNTPPAITSSGTIIVSGNVIRTGDGLSLFIGRDATFKVGGNFSPDWWNGLSGAAYKSFFADMSPNAGSLIFNGGGATVQTMEVLSKGYTAITGLTYFQASGTAPAAGQTVTGGSSGATATINFINGDILQLTSVTGTFQADETLTFSGGGTARAYDTQFAGLDGQTSGSIAHLPIGTLSIGDPAGTNASVKLVNNYNPWVAAENTQAARNLVVTTNSTFDLASFKMVVAAGSNSTVAGLVTNSVAGGTLTLANGASLAFQKGGVIDLDTLTLGAGCKVDFNKAQGSYIRVNGDQKAAFDALIAGGQIVDNGGNGVKVSYSADDAHTTVTLATGSVLIIE